MFYLLLIIPHLIALAALLGYALRTAPSDDPAGESAGSDGEPNPPPNPPRLDPPLGGPPLPDAAPSARRLRDAERVCDLRPRPRGRERPDHPPRPAHRP